MVNFLRRDSLCCRFLQLVLLEVQLRYGAIVRELVIADEFALVLEGISGLSQKSTSADILIEMI